LESIGESFKTIFTRMQNIKMGNIDEAGVSINNVETALKRVNIELRDSPTSFRNMSDVLSDVANKWGGFDEITRASIAQALAGTRQYENLIVLLNNWTTAKDLSAKADDSAGLAQQRYSVYLQGTEAAANKLSATWQKLVMNTTNSGVVKVFLDLATALIKVGDAVGLFNIATVILSGFLATKIMLDVPMVTTMFLKLAGAQGVATLATTTLASALTGGLIGIAIVAAIAAFQLLNKSIVDTYNNFSKLKTEADNNQSELKDLASEYEALSKKQRKTAEDTTRLLDIQTILNTKYGASKDGSGRKLTKRRNLFYKKINLLIQMPRIL
jgi:gas vesicle protein